MDQWFLSVLYSDSVTVVHMSNLFRKTECCLQLQERTYAVSRATKSMDRAYKHPWDSCGTENGSVVMQVRIFTS